MVLPLKGVMQAPVTPMKDDFSFDGEGFAKMVEFHVRHGAPAIAWPHHKAESLNLTIAERKLGAEIAVKTVAKRVPVSIFLGTLSEEDSIDIARHAEKIGADAVLAISPYVRRPTQEEIFDSVVRLGTATGLPILTYNSPWRNGEGVEFTAELTRKLIERLPNYVGMKDASFHSEKFVEISRDALSMRPGFSIIRGSSTCCSAFPLGACGSFSSSGRIAPNLCNKLLPVDGGPRLGDGARMPVQDLAAVESLQGAVSVLAQGRDDHDGTPGRPDALAAAHRDKGAHRLPEARSWKSSAFCNPSRVAGDARSNAEQGHPDRKHSRAGLIHSHPVTPFKRDHASTTTRMRKLIEFHLRNGAEALALPMPEGEDLSLTDGEQRANSRVRGRKR